MADYREIKVNRCQPGYNASCSLCCGSHNYNMSRLDLEDMFIERACRGIEYPPAHQESNCKEKRFIEEIQCSHVGMESSYSGTIGCLIYRDYTLSAEIESFFKGTCRTFLCPAWYSLSDRQILFAAELMRDWYYYSLFINDIEAVHEICSLYASPGDMPAERLLSLKKEVLEKFIDEDGK